VSEVHANGVRLHYEEHGSGDPILCIHGISSSAMVWRDTAVEALSRLGSVIIDDRRSSTRSERPEPYETSVAQHTEDAAALLGALDAVPAIVIGRSYGGDIAIELALRHPELVRGLVLLEAAEVLDAEAKRWAEELRDAIEEAAARDPGSAAEVLFRQIGRPTRGSRSRSRSGRCSSTTPRRSSRNSADRGSINHRRPLVDP
jgi:pimeloyl-ACP methyl ester carboxylesterase